MRDRTTEFQRTIEEKSLRQSRPNKSVPRRERTEFGTKLTHASNEVARQVAASEKKLKSLRALVVSTRLIEDNPIEITELTQIVKESLGRHSRDINTLKSFVNNEGTGKHHKAHARAVTDTLSMKINAASKDFKDILIKRTEILKAKRERRERLTGPADQFQSSSVKDDMSNIWNSLGDSSDDEETQLLDDSTRIDMNGASEQQLALMENNNYVSQRADAMSEINKAVQEVAGIFSDLAMIVHEQGDMVESIAGNVEQAEDSVSAAHGELEKLWVSTKSNKWLMFKVFGILLMFFIFFVVFLA